MRWSGLHSGKACRAVTRQELYDLVWQTPMIKLAKTYGLSDVGLRKICVKYDIPTPPIGYWAKRAHGKRVRQPALPAIKANQSDTIHLVVHNVADLPAQVLQEQEAVLANADSYPPVVIPEERPKKLHPVAAATERSLKAAKVDYEGFRTAVDPGGISVSVGKDSVERVVRIVDAVARAVEARGYAFLEDPKGIRIIVDDVPMSWRIHETRSHTAHEPTKQELERQAKRDEDRRRWPQIYSSRNDVKVYASWDYFPSGRLTLNFVDATRYYYSISDGSIGTWRDRKAAALETCLDEAMRSLALGAVKIRHRLADEAEKERLREQERARWRLEQARKERAVKRHEYLLKKSDGYDRYLKLAAFAEYMEQSVRSYTPEEPVDRLVEDLHGIVDVMAEAFGREGIAQEISGLGLYVEEDLAPVPDPG